MGSQTPADSGGRELSIKIQEARMEGQLKVSAVQVSVQDGNIDVNMANVERMAMKIAENEKGVDLIA